MPPRKRIAIVASYAPSLTNFRFDLISEIVKAGHTIYAMAPEKDELVIEQLQSIGVQFIQIPMARAGLNPFADISTAFTLYRQFRRLKLDMVIPYTMKPIVYGGVAARLAGIRDRCFLVTGLGHVFSDDHVSTKKSLVRGVSVVLYKLAFAGAKVIFVYNDADETDIRKYRLFEHLSRVVPVPGSGVNLDRYPRVQVPAGPPTFLLIARLLRDKGIGDFVEAAKSVRREFPDARFQLLGHFDPNPTAISPTEVDQWVKEGAIEYLGHTRDVRPYLAQCTAFVLPSYYREGIPRSILEAMATGRAIITADTPGCRDTVADGANGFIIPPRDPNALASAMARLARDPALGSAMGQKSHEIAEKRFDVHAVNRLLLNSMSLA